MPKKPLALLILDGFGLGRKEGNAIEAASKPNIDKYFAENPHTKLGCSGMEVGLPDGQMGNSEVGHTNIGAGRVVYQELTRITKSIMDGDFFTNSALSQAMDSCVKNNTKLHLMGLVSNGGVHSHNTHLYALAEMAAKKGVDKVFVHCFLDGRDVPPDSAKNFVAELSNKLAEIGTGKIATIMGRYYAMDRDNRWDRVQLSYDAMVCGVGVSKTNAVDAIVDSYNNKVLDEFIMPTIIEDNATVDDGDSVVFFNFRPDRAREITRAFVDGDFNGFERKKTPKMNFVCMTQYDASMPNVSAAFSPDGLNNTFGEYISQNELTQLRIAETEKYAHVTFFFNGGVESAYKGEDRCLIPSPKVATYDLKPEMSAFEVADEAVNRINSGNYDVIVLNFANCDMVGHTGIFDAAKTAVEVVDTCVGKVVDAIVANGGVALITADHGNADCMVDPETHGAFTAHTTNPVPFLVIGKDCKLKEGKLADIAPTMLDILGLQKPTEMTGESLIVKV